LFTTIYIAVYFCHVLKTLAHDKSLNPQPERLDIVLKQAAFAALHATLCHLSFFAFRAIKQ